MKIIHEDLFMFVIDEKNDKSYFYRFQEMISSIYENSKTFNRLPTYEFELFNNKYNSISQERIIRDLFEQIVLMKDQEEREFNIFDEYTFKLKVVRMK